MRVRCNDEYDDEDMSECSSCDCDHMASTSEPVANSTWTNEDMSSEEEEEDENEESGDDDEQDDHDENNMDEGEDEGSPTIYPRASDVGIAAQKIQRAYRRHMDTRDSRRVLRGLRKVKALTRDLEEMLETEAEILEHGTLKQRLYLQDFLTKSLLAIDGVETNGNETLRSSRRAFVTQKVMPALERVDQSISSSRS